MDMIQSVISASDIIYDVPNAQDGLEVMSMYGGKGKMITAVFPAPVCFFIYFTAIASISSNTSFGRRATSTHALAGQFSLKYSL